MRGVAFARARMHQGAMRLLRGLAGFGVLGGVVVSGAAGAGEPAPVIEKVTPSVVQATTERACSKHPLGTPSIEGKYLQPANTTGYTYHQDVQVYAKAPGADWEQIRVHSGNADIAHLQCLSDGYRKPGTIQIKVVSRGQTSNIATIQVLARPTAAPSFRSIEPQTIPRGAKTVVTFRATNVDDTSKVVLAGRALTAEVDPIRGTLEMLIPRDVQDVTGKYPVLIQNDVGVSDKLVLHVAGPIQPRAAAEVGRNTASSADENLSLAFDGDEPTAARLRVGAETTDVRLDVSGKTARVVVPGSVFAKQPRAFVVELSNPSDKVDVSVPVSYVTKLDRPVPSLGKPKIGGAGGLGR